MNPWKLRSSRTVYANPWIRVREDSVTRPDGQPGIYGVVEIHPSVVILAVDGQERVALVGQWRYTRERFCWELPLGGSHPRDTELLESAVRELREETGLEAAHWRYLGVLDACVGVTTDTQHIYVATGLTQHAPAPDPEERLEVRWVPFPEAVQMVLRGEITESGSVAAILRRHALAK